MTSRIWNDNHLAWFLWLRPGGVVLSSPDEAWLCPASQQLGSLIVRVDFAFTRLMWR